MQLTPEQHALIETLPGWCGPNKRELIAEWVARLARRFREPLACVEIGVYGGQSLMAAAFGLGAHGHLWGIDPYAIEAKDEPTEHDEWWFNQNGNLEEMFSEVVKAFHDYPVSIIRATSAKAVELVPDMLHYLHIDGDHAAESAKFDWETYGSRVVQGGVIVIDDIDWPGVQAILTDVGKAATLRASSRKTKKSKWSAWSLYEVN